MKTTILSIFTLALSSFSLIAEDAPQAQTTTLETLLLATQDNDLKKFESVCDDNMKEAINEENLKQVSVQISAVMKQGYEKIYMGVLNRGEMKTYYWKIDFSKDRAPDMLAELSIINDQVAGFLIR